MPAGYQWLIERHLVGFEPFTQLQPWYYLPPDQCFWATERWHGVSEKRLFVFARRQDNDDLACVSFDADQFAIGVAHIEGWTDSGFHVVEEFSDFWLWLQQVVQDISEWVPLA